MSCKPLTRKAAKPGVRGRAARRAVTSPGLRTPSDPSQLGDPHRTVSRVKAEVTVQCLALHRLCLQGCTHVEDWAPGGMNHRTAPWLARKGGVGSPISLQ